MTEPKEISASKKRKLKGFLFKQYIAGSNRSRSGNVAMALFIIVIAIFSAIPLVMAIGMSLKPLNELFYYPPRLLPERPTLENFSSLFSLLQTTWVPFSRYVFNTLFITIVSTGGHVLLASMAAYPLARRLSKFNKVVSTVILSLMMIPPLSVLVPVYSMMVKIGGVNTYWGIILLSTAGNLPLAIFLYTSFIKAIPVSIDEAGMIDGANRATIFFRLIMPLLKPVTATVIIMTSVGVWNEYAMSNYLLTD